MESSTTHTGGGTVNVAHEFGTWPVQGAALEATNAIRFKFDELLKYIVGIVPKGNERYLSIVKSDLEKACMFAIKAVAKPTGGN